MISNLNIDKIQEVKEFLDDRLTDIDIFSRDSLQLLKAYLSDFLPGYINKENRESILILSACGFLEKKTAKNKLKDKAIDIKVFLESKTSVDIISKVTEIKIASISEKTYPQVDKKTIFQFIKKIRAECPNEDLFSLNSFHRLKEKAEQYFINKNDKNLDILLILCGCRLFEKKTLKNPVTAKNRINELTDFFSSNLVLDISSIFFESKEKNHKKDSINKSDFNSEPISKKRFLNPFIGIMFILIIIVLIIRSHIESFDKSTEEGIVLTVPSCSKIILPKVISSDHESDTKLYVDYLGDKLKIQNLSDIKEIDTAFPSLQSKNIYAQMSYEKMKLKPNQE